MYGKISSHLVYFKPLCLQCREKPFMKKDVTILNSISIEQQQ